MEYTSKYKAEEIEAILDAKNNTGEGVDGMLDGLFVDALQTKDVEASESMEITPDAGYLGLKQVNVTVKGGGGSASGGSGLTYYRFPTYASLDEVPETDTSVVYAAAKVRMEAFGISTIGTTFIGGGNFREDNILDVRAFAIDKGARYIMASGSQAFVDLTIEAYLAQSGVDFSNYEEITEEEFYAL